MSKNFTYLVKFQNQPYADSLYKEGLIYMNPLSYFQKLEDNNLRGDMYENLAAWWQPNKTNVFINPTFIPLQLHFQQLVHKAGMRLGQIAG